MFLADAFGPGAATGLPAALNRRMRGFAAGVPGLPAWQLLEGHAWQRGAGKPSQGLPVLVVCVAQVRVKALAENVAAAADHVPAGPDDQRVGPVDDVRIFWSLYA